MNIALWVVAIVLALVFLAAGLSKLVQSKEKLAPRMAWVEDFETGPIKTIGALEVLGAIGLVVPGVTGIAPILVPLAATGLALLMIGAIVVHARRGEAQAIPVNVVLLLLAVLVAWGRFGPYPFSA
jgi:uncharacterized membrane protein YphA (DoxX/SURF4 family)